MQKPGRLCLALLTLVMVAGVAAQQKPASLRIDGLVDKPGTFDAKSFAGLKRITLKVDDHGEPAVYEGVSLTEVLALAGAPVGDRMRGAQLSLVVVASNNWASGTSIPSRTRVACMAARDDSLRFET